MMHEHEKSDSAIVAKKPANKAGQPAAEPVEQRAGTKGNADQQSTRRTQSRDSVSQALDRVRQARSCASPSNTRGRSRMPELGSSGSVRGRASNGRPYRRTSDPTRTLALIRRCKIGYDAIALRPRSQSKARA